MFLTIEIAVAQGAGATIRHGESVIVWNRYIGNDSGRLCRIKRGAMLTVIGVRDSGIGESGKKEKLLVVRYDTEEGVTYVNAKHECTNHVVLLKTRQEYNSLVSNKPFHGNKH